MKAILMTREFPPYVYGGAGVHVEYLSRELVKHAEIEVKCFGDQNETKENLAVRGYRYGSPQIDENPTKVKGALAALQTSLDFNVSPLAADVVHCHTWYSYWGGVLAKICYGIPLVITVHSLEPLRPWKREQLERGYDLTCWVEKTALEMADCVIAVAESSREEILTHFDVAPERIQVVPNGIDCEEYNCVSTTTGLEKYGVDSQSPYVLFVGRITRQKGIIYLVNAIEHLAPETQVVLCAGAPDTPEIAAEIKGAIEKIQEKRNNVVWIEEMVDKKTAIELYSHASVFCCPSIYEPFGIINLEAMACETAVVASAVGGITQVVVDGETGFLVKLSQNQETLEPLEPEKFSRDLAEKINQLMDNPQLREDMGRRGRQRVVDNFSWASVAERVFAIYQSLQQQA